MITILSVLFLSVLIITFFTFCCKPLTRRIKRCLGIATFDHNRVFAQQMTRAELLNHLIGENDARNSSRELVAQNGYHQIGTGEKKKDKSNIIPVVQMVLPKGAEKSGDFAVIRQFQDIKSRKKDLICPVCCEAFEDHERVKQLIICHHVFHPSCLNDWFKRRPTCPYCNTEQTHLNLQTKQFCSLDTFRDENGSDHEMDQLKAQRQSSKRLSEREEDNDKGSRKELNFIEPLRFEIRTALNPMMDQELRNQIEYSDDMISQSCSDISSMMLSSQLPGSPNEEMP